MSIPKIRQALEKALDAVTPALATAYDNAVFEQPALGTPFQRASLLLATPENPEVGSLIRQSGIFQITLYYPKGKGTKSVEARAQLLLDYFARGTSFSAGLNTPKVIVENTGSVALALPDNDRYIVPISVPFYAFYRP